jgi:hypothetical protein
MKTIGWNFGAPKNVIMSARSIPNQPSTDLWQDRACFRKSNCVKLLSNWDWAPLEIPSLYKTPWQGFVGSPAIFGAVFLSSRLSPTFYRDFLLLFTYISPYRRSPEYFSINNGLLESQHGCIGQ